VKGLLRCAGVGAGLGAVTYLTFKAGGLLMDRAYRTYDLWMRKRHN
jgi:hypothetical protein